MPFQIIRNDITKVKADAIVNTANPKPIIGGGTDSAIYEAAGKNKLLAERRKIGDIHRGDARITPAFNLSAKYVIHTVGPAWQGGEHGEFDILESCYKRSLELAEENGCESIAFPLIATGVYGFPKDEALKIATSTIQEFLYEHDMAVMLVVFDRKAFELSGKVYADVQSYVDENYVKRSYHREYKLSVADSSYEDIEEYERRYRRNEPEAFDDFTEDGSPDEDLVGAKLLDAAPILQKNVFSSGIEDMSLDELIGNPADSFQERLFQLIDRSGLDDVTVYKKANITKKVFSDIKTKKNYKPSKKTAVAFIIALELSMDEAQDLLSRAGFALSPSSRFDLIVGYFISHGNYDMMTINETLFANKQECLGTSLN
ncbi:MAG: macro domain-containing protein [Lachnospiraceae bacterium]|nr:macro domain-containing protein [Lachnospiraceae bacterium]